MAKMPTRLTTIDAFRALTMFLMIFVNDEWTIRFMPEWVKHVKEPVDGLGFADTIVPAFMFIVGLSLPPALDSRRLKGDSLKLQIYHIVQRSAALVIMGFMQVNVENYNYAEAKLPFSVYSILLIVAFFLIWEDYPKDFGVWKRTTLQVSGVLLIVILAFLFKGGTPGHERGLQPYWWGTLGVIGWSYLLVALIYIFSKGKVIVPIIAFVFFLLFDTFNHLHMLQFLDPIRPYVWIIHGGAEPSILLGGMLMYMLYHQMKNNEAIIKLGMPIFIGLASLLVLVGLLLRPIDGISKIRDTPSWVCICTGLSIAAFAIVIYIVDYRDKQKWFKWIWPAGTSTLTCYLVPYIVYAILYPDTRAFWYPIRAIEIPSFLKDGIFGILKSFVFSFLIIQLVGFMEKKRLRIRI